MFVGCLIHQPYEVVAQLLNVMSMKNKGMEKDQEREAMGVQLKCLSKRVKELKDNLSIL